MSETTLYGISNCDTVKKAKKWLDENQIEYSFHDFRKDGLEFDKIDKWLTQPGLDTLLNKRSTTWKQLKDSEKQVFLDNDLKSAKNLLANNPTLIKRPVLETLEGVNVGFKIEEYNNIFTNL